MLNDARLLPELITSVLASRAYRSVAPDLVATIGARELARRPDLKSAIKATKNTLHQIGGAFLDVTMPYDRWLADLRQAATQASSPAEMARGSDAHDRGAARDACRAIMRHHASTRERLPILEDFYQAVFDGLPPVASVLDLGCGLNPLAAPWMPLAFGATYHAVDIFADQMAFLSEALPLLGVAVTARRADITSEPPAERATIALLLKTLPALDALDRTAGARLISAIHAERLVISYPARSLGGHATGMTSSAAVRLNGAIAGTRWVVAREMRFSGETVFMLTRR